MADETGLPTLAWRLEELPPGPGPIALIEVDGGGDEIALARPDGAEVIWVHRGEAGRGLGGRDAGESAAVAALRGVALPEGDGFAWIATEARQSDH